MPSLKPRIQLLSLCSFGPPASPCPSLDPRLPTLLILAREKKNLTRSMSPTYVGPWPMAEMVAALSSCLPGL